MKADLAERAAVHENFHLCICELNLLGDPSLPIHSAPPGQFTPNFPKTLRDENSKFVVSGLPLGAEVTVSDGNQIVFRSKATELGKVVGQLSHPKDNNVPLSIGVRCAGYNSTVKRYSSEGVAD